FWIRPVHVHRAFFGKKMPGQAGHKVIHWSIFRLSPPVAPGSHNASVDPLPHPSIAALPLLAVERSACGNAAPEVRFRQGRLTADANPAPAAISLHRHGAGQSGTVARSRLR